MMVAIIVAAAAAAAMINLRGNRNVGRVVVVAAAAATATAGDVIGVCILYHRYRCDRHVGKLRFDGLYIDVIHRKLTGEIGRAHV